VPSGCDPLLFSRPKSCRSIRMIGVDSGVVTVVP
jgi:hypothetical protein